MRVYLLHLLPLAIFLTSCGLTTNNNRACKGHCAGVISHQKPRQERFDGSSYSGNQPSYNSDSSLLQQTDPIQSTRSNETLQYNNSSSQRIDIRPNVVSNETLQEDEDSSESSFFGNMFQRVKAYFTSEEETNTEKPWRHRPAFNSNSNSLTFNELMSPLVNNLTLLAQYPKQRMKEYIESETENWRNLSFEEREEIRHKKSSFHLISIVSNLFSRGITEIEDDDLQGAEPDLLGFELDNFFSQDIRDTLRQIEEEDFQERNRRDILSWSELTRLQRQQGQNNIEDKYDIASLDQDLQALIREVQERDRQEIREDILSWSELTLSQRQQDQNNIEDRYDIASLDQDLQVLIREVQRKDQQEMDKFPFEWRRTSTRNQSVCTDYSIGEERRVSGIIGVKYNIKRESENVYAAHLPLKFYPGRNYDNERNVPRDQVHPQYFRRVKSCIDEVNSKMLGPNGERLHIVIEDGHGQDSWLVTDIAIQSRHKRSNSRAYASDINCQVITHEVLHLLGLPDEYEERWRGRYLQVSTGEKTFHPIYDCRSVQTNSIMASHWNRFRSVNQSQNSSLLDPAHFNAILYGRCLERDNMRLYFECSGLSYKTSTRNGGRTDCLAQKNYCQGQDILARHLVTNTTDVQVSN